MTGAGGSLGSYICREMLRGGHEVTGYSRTPGDVPGVDWIARDAGNLADLKRAVCGHDAIVHLAAIPGPGRASPEDLVATNVRTTACVLEAAIYGDVGRVVFASSGAVTGLTFCRRAIVPRYFPLDEEHPCEPQDAYGLSKLLGEMTCRSYTDAYGLSTICLRVNNAWYLDREGAEQAVRSGWAREMTVEQLWESRYKKIVADKDEDWPSPGPVSPRKNLWAVSDARDVARAFRLAVERPLGTHEVINLGGHETCSLETTPDLIAKYYPGVLLRRRLSGYDSLITGEKAANLLSFVPQYSWRRSDFADWLRAKKDLPA
jgi:nucleoside-diphosphate-sugar epimerase